MLTDFHSDQNNKKSNFILNLCHEIVLPFNTLQCYLSYTVINCEWDEWAIGECSATCGNGTRTNTRTKLVEEQNGGNCTGQPTETEECHLQDCPGNFLFFSSFSLSLSY